MEKCESSSEEEDLNGESILDGLYAYYRSTLKAELPPTKISSFLENVLHSGSATCLICIGNVKYADAIWSCKDCYCFFHLRCIKRWANDSVSQFKSEYTRNLSHGYYNNLGVYVSPVKPKEPSWCCPQCRQKHKPIDNLQYECFCGKEINPPHQAWLLPHSCGEVCRKNLVPECGHKCLLLCHPGPCPPCPQNVNISCACGMSTPKLMRCFQKQWMCERKCNNILACGKHLCENKCHVSGECPPCNRFGLHPCVCKKEEAMRICSERIWQCKAVCNRKYSCRIHNCKRVCHADSCGECPLGLQRNCPCGKKTEIGPCNEIIDSCGDTCQKLLKCAVHYCVQRCHKGECSNCLIITEKRCRCGKYKKELPCWKTFICETKCKQIRSCGKHACNRKCCDGQCSQCDKICSKVLPCKKHKCKSVCHDGPCYPCKQTSQINCFCGAVSKNVPCGRERRARIKCLQPCRITSKCHHKNSHLCHKNECPPCTQRCGLINETTGCGHICEAQCHSAVVKTNGMKNVNITDNIKKIEVDSLVHPKCEVKVMVVCIGGHKSEELPCWNSAAKSCKDRCNRLLNCGNHYCSAQCHTVKDIFNTKEQEGCLPCTKRCNFNRISGCTHPCQLPCHLPPCSTCNVIIKTKCHCGLSQVGFKCADYNCFEGSKETLIDVQERLRSCGGRCIKNFPCGHRCTKICHSGECADPNTCQKKVRIFCECKCIKFEISCGKHRSGMKSISCDERCELVALENIGKQKERDKKNANKENNNFKFNGHRRQLSIAKYGERMESRETIKLTINWRLFFIYVGIVLTIVVAIYVALHDGL